MPRRFWIRSRNCLPTTSACDDGDHARYNCYRFASGSRAGSRINSAWLVLGGAAVGMIVQTAHIGG